MLRWGFIPDRGLKVIDNLFMLLVVGVASHVKGRRARSMLGELRRVRQPGLEFNGLAWYQLRVPTDQRSEHPG